MEGRGRRGADPGLAAEDGAVNADRAAQDPPLPALGLSAYGIAQCQAVFDSYATQRAVAQESNASVRDRYLSLSDADKVTVEALIDSLVP